MGVVFIASIAYRSVSRSSEAAIKTEKSENDQRFDLTSRRTLKGIPV